jgi:hypothetical protein
MQISFSKEWCLAMARSEEGSSIAAGLGTWRSVYVTDEVCKCGEPAVAKVEEVVFPDDPAFTRHPLTAVLCLECLITVMGRPGVDLVDRMRRCSRE